MKLKNNTLYIFILVLFILVSCDKEIQLNPKNIDKDQLVLNAFLSQPDSISIHISRSTSVFVNNNPTSVENAEVKIFNGEIPIATLIHHENGYYKPTTPVNLSNNIEYKIEASAPNFKTVTALQNIPKKTNFNLRITNEPSDLKPFKLHIDFEDDASEENYYAIFLSVIDTSYPNINDSTKFTIEKNGIYGFTKNSSVENNGGDHLVEEKRATIFLLRDNLFNGKKHEIKISLDYFKSGNSNIKFLVELKSVTKAYFNHILTRQKNKNSQTDPFSQPVQIFSNIKNGLGIFGGYSSAIKTVSTTSF